MITVALATGPALAERFKVVTTFTVIADMARVVAGDAVVVLPEGLPPGRAVLAANMETALNGISDAAPRSGDHIAVVGAGVVGCLTAWLLARV